jgi:hypothetical protein
MMGGNQFALAGKIDPVKAGEAVAAGRRPA